MAIIANDPRNLPLRIIVTTVETFEKKGITNLFLETLLTHKKNKMGINRDKYFMIRTNAVIQTPMRTREVIMLRQALDYAAAEYFHFIMIKK